MASEEGAQLAPGALQATKPAWRYPARTKAETPIAQNPADPVYQWVKWRLSDPTLSPPPMPDWTNPADPKWAAFNQWQEEVISGGGPIGLGAPGGFAGVLGKGKGHVPKPGAASDESILQQIRQAMVEMLGGKTPPREPDPRTITQLEQIGQHQKSGSAHALTPEFAEQLGHEQLMYVPKPNLAVASKAEHNVIKPPTEVPKYPDQSWMAAFGEESPAISIKEDRFYFPAEIERRAERQRALDAERRAILQRAGVTQAETEGVVPRPSPRAAMDAAFDQWSRENPSVPLSPSSNLAFNPATPEEAARMTSHLPAESEMRAAGYPDEPRPLTPPRPRPEAE